MILFKLLPLLLLVLLPCFQPIHTPSFCCDIVQLCHHVIIVLCCNSYCMIVACITLLGKVIDCFCSTCLWKTSSLVPNLMCLQLYLSKLKVVLLRIQYFQQPDSSFDINQILLLNVVTVTMSPYLVVLVLFFIAY